MIAISIDNSYNNYTTLHYITSHAIPILSWRWPHPSQDNRVRCHHFIPSQSTWHATSEDTQCLCVSMGVICASTICSCAGSLHPVRHSHTIHAPHLIDRPPVGDAFCQHDKHLEIKNDRGQANRSFVNRSRTVSQPLVIVYVFYYP